MQLTGWENANNMRNAKCAGTQISMEWPYCSFLYCEPGLQVFMKIKRNYHVKKTKKTKGLYKEKQGTLSKVWLDYS